jgi:hypothetical protein
MKGVKGGSLKPGSRFESVSKDVESRAKSVSSVRSGNVVVSEVLCDKDFNLCNFRTLKLWNTSNPFYFTK